MSDLKQVVKDAITEVVKGSSGIKLMEIIAHGKIVDYYMSEAGEKFDFVNLVDELVHEKKVIEIEYMLPGTDRVKSFLLPHGTEINIRKR